MRIFFDENLSHRLVPLLSLTCIRALCMWRPINLRILKAT